MGIRENLDVVKACMKNACAACGRAADEVKLIAVSKTKPVPALEEAYAYGCRDFGENKVQELVDKYERMPKDIRWHMIGHLQRNKVKYIVDKVFLIHSVDSLRLAQEIGGGKEEGNCQYPCGSKCGRGGEQVWNHSPGGSFSRGADCQIAPCQGQRIDDHSSLCRGFGTKQTVFCKIKTNLC